MWATTFGPTKKLSEQFKQSKNVYLIFSITEGGGYQGFAKMKGAPDSAYKPECFVKGKNALVQYCDNFAIEWQVKNIFYHFKNLNNFPPNPLNENKTIMQSKNG